MSTTSQPMERRNFLRAAVATAAGVGLAGLGSGTAMAGAPSLPENEAQRRIPSNALGMHTFTMRGSMAQDAAGTYARLAQIGYQTIGLSGRAGHSAAAHRQMMDAVDLKCKYEHVQYTRMFDRWEEVLEEVRILGGKYAVFSSLPGSYRGSVDAYKRAAEEMNIGGQVARQYGLELLFHNHGHDHEVVDGQNLYDILLEETEQHLVGFELDTHWMVKPGYDPVDYLLGYPGRFPVFHVKDMGADGSFQDAGAGILDFPRIFAAAHQGGIKQWMVEHDRPPISEWYTAQACYDYLSTVRF